MKRFNHLYLAWLPTKTGPNLSTPCGIKLAHSHKISEDMVEVGWGIGRKVVERLAEKRYNTCTAELRRLSELRSGIR